MYGGNICTRVSNIYFPVLLSMRNTNGNIIEPFTNNTAKSILYLNFIFKLYLKMFMYVELNKMLFFYSKIYK